MYGFFKLMSRLWRDAEVLWISFVLLYFNPSPETLLTMTRAVYFTAK